MMNWAVSVIALTMAWSVSWAAPEYETNSAGPHTPSDLVRKGNFGPLDKFYNAQLAKGDNDRNPSGQSNATLFIGEVMPPVIQVPSPDRAKAALVPPGSPLPELKPYGNDLFWTPVQAQARSWLAVNPESTLAVNVLADSYIKQAWSYRGNQLAVHVKPQAFAKFDEVMREAWQVLRAHEVKGKSDPNWWARMIEVTYVLGMERGEWNVLVNSAITTFPHHQSIYFRAARGKLPSWGGSHAEVAELVEKAVRNTEAREGQSMYALIYWSLSNSLDVHPLVSKDVDWSRIRTGFDDLLARYPHRFNLNHYARLACAARDKVTVQRLMQTVSKDPDPNVWGSREHFMRCKGLPND